MAEAQNFRVAAKNYTGYDFVAGNEAMQWGGVYDKQNVKRETTTTSVFYARGNRDAAAGTQGSLTYTAHGHPETTIKFSWDIPWGSGDDKLEVTVTGNIKLEKSSFRGSEVLRNLVTIEIRDDKPIL